MPATTSTATIAAAPTAPAMRTTSPAAEHAAPSIDAPLEGPQQESDHRFSGPDIHWDERAGREDVRFDDLCEQSWSGPG